MSQVSVQRVTPHRRRLALFAVLALLASMTSLVGLGSGTAGAAIDPPAIIDNGTIQLGINEAGDLNVPGPASSGGTSYVGLRYLPTNAESTAPGCLCEGWGAADATSGATGWANRDQGGENNLSVVSFDTTASTAVSVVDVLDGGANPVLRVKHDYRPSATANLYEVEVTLTNVSGATVDPRYRRVMDWDIEPTAFSEYSTIQGTAAAANVLFASDDGFANGDPLSGPASIDFTGDAVDSGPNDHGALFDFGFDPLAPGDSTTFLTYYGAAGNEVDAEAALGAVNAEIYSFGQPSTPDGPTLGTPNTFIFAFAGVGGAPIIPAVRFADSAYSVSEAGGSATIGVELTAPADTDVTVDYATSAGTATPGSDYTETSGSLTIPVGSTSGSFVVPVLDDVTDEPDETVNLSLTNPVGAVAGTPAIAQLTIVDNDDPGQVNLPPVVDSGVEMSAEVGAGVVLAGSATDPDNGPVTPLEISWILTALGGGADTASCTFTGTDTVTPTLNCSTAGEYLAQIGAFDGEDFVDDLGTKVTFTDPVPTDTTAPVCELISASSAGISVRVVDPGSGVDTIDVTRQKNANVVVPAFTPGTNDELVVTATKIKMGSGASVQMRVTDVDGNETVCDPVIAKLTAGESKTFYGVPAEEHYLTVSEAGGVAGVAVEVNGTSRVVWSPDGRTVDLGDMGDGTVTLRVLAAEGTTATIMLWDGK